MSFRQKSQTTSISVASVPRVFVQVMLVRVLVACVFLVCQGRSVCLRVAIRTQASICHAGASLCPHSLSSARRALLVFYVCLRSCQSQSTGKPLPARQLSRGSCVGSFSRSASAAHSVGGVSTNEGLLTPSTVAGRQMSGPVVTHLFPFQSML